MPAEPVAAGFAAIVPERGGVCCAGLAAAVRTVVDAPVGDAGGGGAAVARGAAAAGGAAGRAVAGVAGAVAVGVAGVDAEVSVAGAGVARDGAAPDAGTAGRGAGGIDVDGDAGVGASVRVTGGVDAARIGGTGPADACSGAAAMRAGSVDADASAGGTGARTGAVAAAGSDGDETVDAWTRGVGAVGDDGGAMDCRADPAIAAGVVGTTAAVTDVAGAVVRVVISAVRAAGFLAGGRVAVAGASA